VTPFRRAAGPGDASAAGEQGSLRQAVARSERRRERRTAQGRWRIMALLALLILGVDQILKWAIRATVAPGEDWISLSSHLAIAHHRNDGIAFGLFAGSGRAVGLITAIVLPLIAVGLAALARERLAVAICGALLLGGSISNLADRLLRGQVTDYIDVDVWPAFNLADVAIVGGVGLFLWVLSGDDHSPEPETGQP
jgi:signal peptidase II